jgi:hypothetical protein
MSSTKLHHFSDDCKKNDEEEMWCVINICWKSKKGDIKLTNVLVVREFSNVFPNELLRLSLRWEIKVLVKIISWTIPISWSYYRITLVDLRELKLQLQELLDKWFIQPSNSH